MLPQKKITTTIAIRLRTKIASGLPKPRSEFVLAIIVWFCPLVGSRTTQRPRSGNIFRRPCRGIRDCSSVPAAVPGEFGRAAPARESIQRRPDVQARRRRARGEIPGVLVGILWRSPHRTALVGLGARLRVALRDPLKLKRRSFELCTPAVMRVRHEKMFPRLLPFSLFQM